MASAPTPASALRISGLTLRRNGRSLLESVSLELGSGEFGMLLGPNGAGKSLLLRAVMGLIPYDAGDIEVCGGRIDSPAIRLSVSYVPQRIAIENTLPLTIEEFLVHYRRVRQRLASRARRDSLELPPLDALIEDFGLGAKRRQPLSVLSGGELQRLLLVAAFSDAPALLLLDEPLAGVDAQGEAHFYETLVRYRDQHPGTALLVVSHDIGVVSRFADRVFCLNRELHAEGPPSQVLTQETFRKLYGDEHAHRLHDHSHHHHHDH